MAQETKKSRNTIKGKIPLNIKIDSCRSTALFTKCLSKLLRLVSSISFLTIHCIQYFGCSTCCLQNQREQNYTVLKTRSNMMTVEGLKPGTTYVFRVRARTDGGYGSYGGEIELETSHEGKVKTFNRK